MEGPLLPPQRQWKSAAQLSDSGSPTFTLASYNILSENLLKNSSYFNKIKPENWHRDVRHSRLMREVDSLDADILCLQEVDKDYWFQRLETDLRCHGYTIFAYSWRSSAPVEGVAICARGSAFLEADNDAIDADGSCRSSRGGCLSDLVTSRLIDAGQPDRQALADYASAPQQYCILRLEHRTSGCKLTVSNAHVSYQRPAKPDLRAAQAVAMVAETASFANRSAFVVCGDFNSTPESLAYRCVTQKPKEPVSSMKKACQDQNLPLLKVLSNNPNDSQIRCGGGISSAYLEVFGSEPACTLNLTNNSGCVDFIFYDNQHLRPLAALEVPSWYIQRDKDCAPDQNLASDHLSIAVKFSLI